MAGSHQFGNLAVAALDDNSFEVVHLASVDLGVALARIEVDESCFPTLRIHELEGEQRGVQYGLKPVSHALIASRKSDHPTSFELTVAAHEGGIRIELSGDHRCMAGDRHYRLFYWKAECRYQDGQLRITGPYLAGDPDS